MSENQAARIPFLSKEEALARGREHGIDDYISQLNLFRVLLHYPDAAREFNNTIITLVSGDSILSHRLRELIIMRVAWQTASSYEWTQHWQVCQMFGMSDEEIEAVKNWQESQLLDETDKAVLAATDDTLEMGKISPSNWEKLKACLPEPASQIAVVGSIGNWLMFSQLLQSLDIPLEDGAPVWPPNGNAPAS